MTATETTTTVVVPGRTSCRRSSDLAISTSARSSAPSRTPRSWSAATRSAPAASEADEVGRLFEELVGLLQRGHHSTSRACRRVIDMVSQHERPSEVLTDDILRGAKGRQVRPKTAGQKRYIDAIANNVITFGIGPAGTGKSWLAVAMAVKALQTKQVQRIILTRPAVEAGERLGFLPGDLMAKIDPYLRPLYDALYDMVEPEGAQRLLERQTVEVAPLAFMRGRTLNNSFIILDEAQNTTPEQMKMFLTRIGFGSQVVVTGDVDPDRRARRQQRAARPRARAEGHRGPGLRAARRGRRRAPPHRRRHRRGVRAQRRSAAEMGEPPSPTAARRHGGGRRRARPRPTASPSTSTGGRRWPTRRRSPPRARTASCR